MSAFSPARPHILIVDDAPTNIEMLAASLEDEYELLFALSGEEALQIAAATPPDLILLDVIMPGLNGYDTYRQLRQIARLQHVPVVFLTAISDSEAETTGLALGAADFITKPFHLPHTRLRIRNLLERYRLELLLQEQRERLHVTLNSIGDAVITTDAANHVEYLNPVAEHLTGWPLGEAGGRQLAQVFRLTDDHASRGVLPGAEPLALQTRLIRRDGTGIAIEDSVAPIRGADGAIRGTVRVFRDVTRQRRLAQQVSWQATHDPLTGLINRVEFERSLQQALVSAGEFDLEHALLYLDLDQFKVVNDTCGHAAGDQLLRQISKVMGDCVRSGDILARLGGDEFAILLHQCDSRNALNVAQTICANVDRFRFFHDNRRHRVGVSIGLVAINRCWECGADLLQAADSACYTAKEAGRNRVHTYHDQEARILHHRGQVSWASRIEAALDSDSFRLFGQIIAPASGRSGGLHCEVLLRMNDPSGQLILPGAFMPPAERFHMAGRIDRWVIRNVLHLLDARRDGLDGLDQIAINLSGQSISDLEFHRYLDQLLRGLHFDVRKLCFEITETSAITQMEEATRFMAAMRAYGVRFSLDDFGGGVSSFDYLKCLPFDYIKIDGQFVANVSGDVVAYLTVKYIAELGRATGRKTIAECVEAAEVRAALQQLGVDYVQGHHVHLPESLEAVLSGSGQPLNG